MYELAPIPCKTEFPRLVFCLFIHAFLPILGHLHMQPMDQCFLMNVYLSGKTAPRLVQWSGTSNELDAYQPCCHCRWKVILGFHVLQCPSNDAVGKEKVKDFSNYILVVVLDIFYFHPYLGKIPILTIISQRGWNHQLDINYIYDFPLLLALRAISYSLGALHMERSPAVLASICSASFQRGAVKTRSAGSPRTDESYGVSGSDGFTWGTWVLTDPSRWDPTI